jgi:hypothetical protein
MRVKKNVDQKKAGEDEHQTLCSVEAKRLLFYESTKKKSCKEQNYKSADWIQ